MAEGNYKRWLQGVIGLQCLLILAFVLRGWIVPAPLGPRLPAVSGDMLWLQSHGALHGFDRQGTRRQRLAWQDLGLTDAASSLQFTGPQRFWAHDRGRVHRCTLEPLRCDALDLPGLPARDSYRWVRVEDEGARIIVSDASQHRILVYQREGARHVLVRTHAQGLRFPNQTLPAGEGMWVANTNRHEIARIEGAAVPQSFAVAHADLRDGRRFPFAMQRDDRQRLWVLVADAGMRHADLLQMDAALRPERVLPLSPDQDPNAVVLWGTQLLLTDMTRFTVHRLDLDGRQLPSFGDAQFQAELEAARAAHAWSRRLPTLLLASIGVLMALALWLAWKSGELRQLSGRRWREVGDAGASGTPVPDVPATQAPRRRLVTLVSAQAGRTKRRRQVLVVAGVLNSVAMVAALSWAWPLFYQRDCGPDMVCDPTGWLRVLLVAVGLLPALIHVLAWRRLRQLEGLRIATDGQRIGVCMAGKIRKLDASQVTCTRQHLWMGIHAIPLRLNGSPLFDEPALRREILARLPQLQLRDGAWDFAVPRHFWRHAGWQGKALVLVYGLLLLLSAAALALA